MKPSKEPPQPLDLTRKDLQPLKERLKGLIRLRKKLAAMREKLGIPEKKDMH